MVFGAEPVADVIYNEEHFKKLNLTVKIHSGTCKCYEKRRASVPVVGM